MSIPANNGQFSKYNPTKPLPGWQMAIGIALILPPAIAVMMVATVIGGAVARVRRITKTN